MNLALILAVAAVGILHTMVPDHWAPIALVARRAGWTRSLAVRTAVLAGIGHVVSTLIIALAVWFLGVVAAKTIGTLLTTVSSAALVLFGGYVAYGAIRELREESAHGHAHEHETGRHDDRRAGSLAFILGSSPMIEGIPAFFAAGKYGTAQLVVMALVFAASTILTYAVLVWTALAGLERVNLGPVERYGELLSGLLIVALGVVFYFVG